MYIHSDQNKTVNINQVERWLGAERVLALQASMAGWYSSPIPLLDLPGGVKLSASGDFIGTFKHGGFASAMDSLEDSIRKSWRDITRLQHGQANVGFLSIGDALARASSGFGQVRQMQKSGPLGVVNVTSSLFKVGATPSIGGNAGAAPGGTAYTNTSVGALPFANPATGTNHLVGADIAVNVANNSLLIYDRIFGVNKTMNSSAAEAVTGVPTRYQNTIATAPDYIGGNFVYPEVGATALAATVHNWTLCTYMNENNITSVLPNVIGNSGAIIHRQDMGVQSFFAPLAAGDVGIRSLTNIQCSAAVATGVIEFIIGHPLGIMGFPIAGLVLPTDWLTNRNQAPQIFNNACIAFLEMTKPSTTACSYAGQIYTTSAAA